MNLYIDKNVNLNIRKNVHVVTAKRQNIPDYISTFSILVTFIKPSYARLGASPTKIAECFASGIPIISNNGIGDLTDQVYYLKSGYLVENMSSFNLNLAADQINKIVNMGGKKLRESSKEIFDLEIANSKYLDIYNQLM
jgi:glycosyltransferase involved in cell wall biosynthesis